MARSADRNSTASSNVRRMIVLLFECCTKLYTRLTLRTMRIVTAILLLSVSPLAQTPATLTPEDKPEIQALVTGYARALGACRAEEYADLFAPETGFFASGIRGQVTGREKLIALVQSERQCITPAGAATPARPSNAGGPTVTLEV